MSYELLVFIEEYDCKIAVFKQDKNGLELITKKNIFLSNGIRSGIETNIFNMENDLRYLCDEFEIYSGNLSFVLVDRNLYELEKLGNMNIVPWNRNKFIKTWLIDNDLDFETHKTFIVSDIEKSKYIVAVEKQLYSFLDKFKTKEGILVRNIIVGDLLKATMMVGHDMLLDIREGVVLATRENKDGQLETTKMSYGGLGTTEEATAEVKSLIEKHKKQIEFTEQIVIEKQLVLNNHSSKVDKIDGLFYVEFEGLLLSLEVEMYSNRDMLYFLLNKDKLKRSNLALEKVTPALINYSMIANASFLSLVLIMGAVGIYADSKVDKYNHDLYNLNQTIIGIENDLSNSRKEVEELDSVIDDFNKYIESVEGLSSNRERHYISGILDILNRTVPKDIKIVALKTNKETNQLVAEGIASNYATIGMFNIMLESYGIANIIKIDNTQLYDEDGNALTGGLPFVIEFSNKRGSTGVGAMENVGNESDVGSGGDFDETHSGDFKKGDASYRE